MTARRASMPCIDGTSVHWDGEAGKVRYYASFDGTDAWIEVSGENFSHLSFHFVRELGEKKVNP